MSNELANGILRRVLYEYFLHLKSHNHHQTLLEGKKRQHCLRKWVDRKLHISQPPNILTIKFHLIYERIPIAEIQSIHAACLHERNLGSFLRDNVSLHTQHVFFQFSICFSLTLGVVLTELDDELFPFPQTVVEIVFQTLEKSIVSVAKRISCCLYIIL